MHVIRISALVPALGVGLLAVACNKSGGPTGPSTATAGVPAAMNLSVGPVPVLTRAHWSSGGGPVLYEIDGAVTFQDASGSGGRVTAIEIALVSIAGDAEGQTLPVDLAVPPGGVVTQSIAQAVELPRAVAPAQLRISATVRGALGSVTTTRAVEVPVSVTVAGEGGGFPDATFVGAGDIAVCNWGPSEATARLLDGERGTVFTLGDNTYPTGSTTSFTNCYGPTWGRHRARTRPAPGNHDWDEAAGAPYFSYFGAAAGPAGLGYYSYTVGTWHVLSLNSNVPANQGSAQYEWARNDLATSNTACSLAYWHHPRFSSGPNGNHDFMRDMWRLLHRAGVELVLSGHDHNYERFAPQDADGHFDPQGIRAFVVGTGGAPQRPFKLIQANSEVRDNQTYGVLRLGLRARGYDWEFVPISGQSFRDIGAAQCR
jgi:hypothetical protein